MAGSSNDSSSDDGGCSSIVAAFDVPAVASVVVAACAVRAHLLLVVLIMRFRAAPPVTLPLRRLSQRCSDCGGGTDTNTGGGIITITGGMGTSTGGGASNHLEIENRTLVWLRGGVLPVGDVVHRSQGHSRLYDTMHGGRQVIENRYFNLAEREGFEPSVQVLARTTV